MASTHVCLISEQPIPNLLPLLVEKPAKAIFLVSPEMTTRSERLQKVVRRYGIEVETREVPAFDFGAMAAVCRTILKEAGDADMALNATGGTKVGALAAFQVFSADTRRIIYLDSSNDTLLDLAPVHRAVPLAANLLRLEDCLISYGMNPLPSGPAAGQDWRRAGLESLVHLLVGEKDLLGRWNNVLRPLSGERKSYLNLSLNRLGKGAEALAERLEGCRVARRTGASNLNISSIDKIFFCRGGWLEEYCYWTVKSLGLQGLDLAMNVKVKWDGQGRRPTENEFDVLFTYGNRLHLISCKASNPDWQSEAGTRAMEALNELDALADRAGGLYGKAMLVSARRLRGADRERAKKMKINLVDGQEVLQLDEHLRRWLAPER